MELADYSLSELQHLYDAVLYRLENMRLDRGKIVLNAWLTRIHIAINQIQNDVDNELVENG